MFACNALRRATTLALLPSCLLQTALAQEQPTEEVVVTSTALRERSLDVAQPTQVLSGDELRRRIAVSIGESLAAEPGVSASWFGPGASRPVIRGLGGERVLMLQNGLSALDVSSLSQDHAASIEAVLADQIEIVRGPAVLSFGSAAVGGVVNVVDGRIPVDFSEDADRMAVEVRGDSALGERAAVGRIDFGSQAVRAHVDGFYRDTDDVEIPGFALSRAEREERLEQAPDEAFAHGVLPNSDGRVRGGSFGASAGGERGLLGASWNRFEANYAVPGGHGLHEEEGGEHGGDVRIDMRQDRYDVKGERELTAGAFERLRLLGAYNRYEHVELEGADVGARFEQDGYELRLNLDHAAGAWRGTIGAQHTLLDFAAFGEESFTPPSKTRQSALFVFEKLDLGAGALELGARVERQSVDPESTSDEYTGTAVSVSAGGLWRFADPWSLSVNVTRSQRHPQAAELYAHGPHLAIGRFEIGDPGLTRETAHTLDLALHRHGDDGLHWSAGVFYNDFADYIHARPLGLEIDGLPVHQYVQADAELYGFEAEVTIPVLRTSAGKLEVRLASDYVRGRLAAGGDLPQIPPLRYGCELHYEAGPLHLGLDAYAYEAQRNVAPGERPTDGYTMLDADASYRFDLGARSLLVFLRGSNLLDEEARRHTSALKDVAPLPGRSLHLGVRAEL